MISLLDVHYLYAEPGIREIHLIGQFLDAFLYVYLIGNFFEARKSIYKTRNWKTGLVIVFTAILALTDKFFSNNFYTYCIAMVLIPIIYVSLFYRGEQSIKILVCIIFFALMNMLDAVAISLMDCMANEAYMVTETTWNMIFFTRRILFKGILYLLLRVLMLDIMQKCTHIRKIYWYYLGFVSVFAYVLGIVWDNIQRNIPKYGYVKLLSSGSCLFMIVSSCWMAGNIMKLDELQKQELVRKMTGKAKVQDLEEIEKVQEEFHKFRHDYKAHLFAIDMMVEEKEYEKLHQYLSCMHENLDSLDGTVMYTDSNVINILMEQKKQKAKSKCVDLFVSSNVKLEEILDVRIKLYDFVSLISNLCDNAIDAAAKVENGFVRLNFSQKKSYLQIESLNSTYENMLVENPAFETDKSEKRLHGYGTKIIWKIVEKYDGIHNESGDENSLKMQILLNINADISENPVS